MPYSGTAFFCTWEEHRELVAADSVSTLREALFRLAPDLRFCNFSLISPSGSEIVSDNDLLSLSSREVTIRINPPKKFISEDWRRLSQCLFFLVTDRDEIVGTGFALSRELALITVFRGNGPWKAVFGGESVKRVEFLAQKLKICLGKLGEGTVYIVKITPVEINTLIELDAREKRTSKVGWVIYYTDENPEILTAQLKLNSLKGGKLVVTEGEQLPKSAIGCPMFSPGRKFLGLYSSEAVLMQSDLAEKLIKQPFTIQNKCLVAQVLSSWEGLGSASNSPCFYLLNPQTNSLVVRKASGTERHELPRHLDSGASLLHTEQCLLITGVVVTREDEWLMHPAAFLYTEARGLEEQKATVWPHAFHVSIESRQGPMIISGVNSQFTEIRTSSEQWTAHSFPFVRAKASAVRLNASIYLVGGLGWNLSSWKKSILVFDGEEWRKLRYALPGLIAECGVAVKDSLLWVFGGRVRGGQWNDNVYQLNTATGELKTESQPELRGLFSWTSPSKSSDELIFPSLDGRCYVSFSFSFPRAKISATTL